MCETFLRSLTEKKSFEVDFDFTTFHSKMDTDSLLQLLQATLDPNPNTRVQAELNLVEASRSSGKSDISSATARESANLGLTADQGPSNIRDGTWTSKDCYGAKSRSSS